MSRELEDEKRTDILDGDMLSNPLYLAVGAVGISSCLALVYIFWPRQRRRVNDYEYDGGQRTRIRHEVGRSMCQSALLTREANLTPLPCTTGWDMSVPRNGSCLRSVEGRGRRGHGIVG